jgi:hypothetical protein
LPVNVGMALSLAEIAATGQTPMHAPHLAQSSVKMTSLWSLENDIRLYYSRFIQ